MRRLLIYAQDRGGANIVALVAGSLAALPDAPAADVVAHQLSEPIFDRLGVGYEKLTARFERLPVELDRMTEWLASTSTSHIICTTSSRFVDMTNCRLIEAARNLGVPTLSYLDHWIGFDRFVDDAGEPKYLTDVMGCIDQYCADRLEALGMPKARVRVVGHPHLEAVRNAVTRPSSEPARAVRICLVSQPSMRDRSFRGLFEERVGARPLLESVATMCGMVNTAGRSLEVRYRPHPKETGVIRLPQGITMDDTPGDMRLYERHDIFIGVTSMVLIEAAVARCHTIRLDLAELGNAAPALRLPQPFPVEISELGQLPAALQRAIDARLGGAPPPEFGAEFVNDALSRASDLAREFLQ